MQGSQLVVRLPEGTRELTVPDDFRFTVDGKQLALAELKPGMKGTATITTRTTVTPVTVTEVKNGTVMQATGASVLVKTDEGFKNFTQGDLDKRGVKIMRDGKAVELSSPPQGRSADRHHHHVEAAAGPDREGSERVTCGRSSPRHGSERRRTGRPVNGRGHDRSAAATTGAGAAAAPAPGARKLPKTASSWPLLGLASVVMLVLALALTLRRRFAL